jgi:predicted metal-dependent phosphoesterase TrpH
MSKVDLHIHSTASDGRLSPAEVVHKAAELGLTIIALTDHDTVDGVAPALAAAEAYPQLKIIPAIEISTDMPTDEVHVLGYFIEHTDQELRATLERMRHSRQHRAQRMIAKLDNLGMPLDWQRVQEIAGGGSVGRPHLAQAMLEKGYIASFREAFTKYIGRDGSAYVVRDKMTPQEAVRLILRSKGVPVLAHPLTISDPEKMIVELKAAGLAGIEAYYDSYTADEVERLLGLASRYGLITSGGSDYHGLDASIETMMGGAGVPMVAAEQLIARAEQRAAKLADP